MKILIKLDISVVIAKYLYLHKQYSSFEKKAKLASLFGFGMNTQLFKLDLVAFFLMKDSLNSL